MTYFLIGLILFLGVHSIRIAADDWRSGTIARVGLWSWKGLYAAVSIAGFVLLVWGYGMARHESAVLYQPPLFTRHIAALLVLVAFVLVTAAYVPRNHIKAAIGHPMYAGIKLWAFAHLISNGRVIDVLLFGAFLVWAVVGFISARRRDRRAGASYPPGSALWTVSTLVIGVAAWLVFALKAHVWLIGVAPFALGR